MFLFLIFSFLFHCTNKNPLNVSEYTPFNMDNTKNIRNNLNGIINNSLTKATAFEHYISTKADLQFSFLKPKANWKMIDLTDARSVISVYSPKPLVNSHAEDLLPRVTIVEMMFKESEMSDGNSWKRTVLWGANYRKRKLREKYGEENVNIIRKEESIFKNIPCIHFTYEVKYPVSGKDAITDEYGFFHNNHYYIIQLSKPLNDINDNIMNEGFNRFFSSLKILKSLIS